MFGELLLAVPRFCLSLFFLPLTLTLAWFGLAEVPPLGLRLRPVLDRLLALLGLARASEARALADKRASDLTRRLRGAEARLAACEAELEASDSGREAAERALRDAMRSPAPRAAAVAAAVAADGLQPQPQQPPPPPGGAAPEPDPPAPHPQAAAGADDDAASVLRVLRPWVNGTACACCLALLCWWEWLPWRSVERKAVYTVLLPLACARLLVGCGPGGSLLMVCTQAALLGFAAHAALVAPALPPAARI